ncbi:TPA: hypothetical protein RQK97_004216 [Vibrio vulnificus]|nr:hypothetical protein [Vibrio vulnificus]MCU8251590.1 hypothetical protein [Vibrio vulnificus]HDY7974336.1 hypothetical protein [Vibrio vulnificus]HDY8109181.1 hypothetical protein [Vibrio vulnificus]
MKKIIFSVLAFSVLSGCTSAPTRLDISEFESLMSGSIPTDAILEFTGCVYDGFLSSHSMLTDIDTKQQIRSDGYRVETYSGGRMLLMSADILNSGHVELWESSAAAFINTSGERQAFESCLVKYQLEKQV